MITLKIKPLSLNNAYRGRRFATKELEAYKQSINFLSPKMTVPAGKLKIKYVFGVSSKNADGDNLIKCVQDAIATKYGFNDREIYKWEVEKIDVKKGEEFVCFEISSS